MKDSSIFNECTKYENDNKDISILEDGTCIQVSLTVNPGTEMISVLFGPSEDRRLCYISLTAPEYIVGDNLGSYKDEVVESISLNWDKISTILQESYKDPVYNKPDFSLSSMPDYSRL